MTNEKVKRMFDAFYQAKRIREMLPALPKGIMPSYSELPIVLSQWASCFIDLVTYYLHRR